MKCTQCGCENLIPVEISDYMDLSGEANLYINKFLKIYNCCDCGHLEFFDNSRNEKMKAKLEIEKKYDNELSVLAQKQDELEKELKQLADELSSISVKSGDLDITIRQQAELNIQANKIRSQIKDISEKKLEIEKEIEKVEKVKQYYLDKVDEEYNKKWIRL